MLAVGFGSSRGKCRGHINRLPEEIVRSFTGDANVE
jgi:hypothetical protein